MWVLIAGFLVIFMQAGFPRSHVYIGARGTFIRCPGWLAGAVESALGEAYSEPVGDVRGYIASVKTPA